MRLTDEMQVFTLDLSFLIFHFSFVIGANLTRQANCDEKMDRHARRGQSGAVASGVLRTRTGLVGAARKWKMKNEK